MSDSVSGGGVRASEGGGAGGCDVPSAVQRPQSSPGHEPDPSGGRQCRKCHIKISSEAPIDNKLRRVLRIVAGKELLSGG